MAEPKRCTPTPTETVWSTLTVDIPVESVITRTLDAPEPLVTEYVLTSRSCLVGGLPFGCSDVVETRTTTISAAETGPREVQSTATSMSAQVTSTPVETLYAPCTAEDDDKIEGQESEGEPSGSQESSEAEPSAAEEEQQPDDEDQEETPPEKDSDEPQEAMSVPSSTSPSSTQPPTTETIVVINSLTSLSTTVVPPLTTSSETSTLPEETQTPEEVNETAPIITSTSTAVDTAFLPDQTISAILPANNSESQADAALINPDDAGKRVGVIVGSVAGVFVGILLLLLLARCLYRRFARNKELEDLDIFLTKNHESRSSLDEGDADDRTTNMEEQSSISKDETTFVMERPPSVYSNARPISTYSLHYPTPLAPNAGSTWAPAEQILAGRTNSHSSRPSSSFSHSRKSSYNSLYSINELPNMAGLGVHSFIAPAPLRPTNVRFEQSSAGSTVESLPMPSYAQQPELYSPVDQQVGISRLRVMNEGPQ